jgi:hypothetical protein
MNIPETSRGEIISWDHHLIHSPPLIKMSLCGHDCTAFYLTRTPKQMIDYNFFFFKKGPYYSPRGIKNGVREVFMVVTKIGVWIFLEFSE